jgi:excinuclease ABC subunit A
MFAGTAAARHRGLTASAFSFNSRIGQCEQCRGAGFEKIEMQFLSDVFIRCPACDGRRYRQHVLEIKMPLPDQKPPIPAPADGLSIADFLELTVEDALEVLCAMTTRAADQAARRLRILAEVGLGYLRLGQPINTLSGGESQRLKLAGHFASILRPVAGPCLKGETVAAAEVRRPRTFFIFDEPTTGLHFEDVGVLLDVFQRLVEDGHSVLIIEHNLEVLKCADWLIDLGPEGGNRGGRIVAAGTPEHVAACGESHTGHALRTVLPTPP